jgi:hypothetical protein
MNRFLLSILAAVFFLAGCAAHYSREENGRVHLYLKDGRAREVQFASSRDGFVLHPAEKADAKTWKATVPMGGEFQYFYVVDGRVRLPDCPYREEDDFGSHNCLYKPEP